MNQPARRCILAVFAHPDDETSTAAGTFIKYAREGVEIHVVTVTACNRNGPGLQSARFPAHIKCLYPSPPAHISCL